MELVDSEISPVHNEESLEKDLRHWLEKLAPS